MSLEELKKIYYIDFEDIDFLERYYNAYTKFNNRIKSIKKDGNVIDQLKKTCEYYRKFFDEIFGNGASNKIFGQKNNIRLYEETLITLINENTRVNERMAERRTFVQPKNRAQRRNQK